MSSTYICGEKAEGSEQNAKQTRMIFIIKLEFPESPDLERSYFIISYTEPTQSGVSKSAGSIKYFCFPCFREPKHDISRWQPTDKLREIYVI